MTKTAAEIRAEATAAVAHLGTELPAAPVVDDKDAIIANLQAQLAATLQVLGGAPAAPAKVERKAYRSIHSMLRVPIMRAPGHCDFVEFVAGRLETEDPAVVAVLDRAIAAGGSGIYVGDVAPDTSDIAVMKEDVRTAAEAAQTKMVKAGLATA